MRKQKVYVRQWVKVQINDSITIVKSNSIQENYMNIVQVL